MAKFPVVDQKGLEQVPTAAFVLQKQCDVKQVARMLPVERPSGLGSRP